MDAREKWLDDAAHLTGWRHRKFLRETINADILNLIEKEGKEAELELLFDHPFFSFEPRPNNKAGFDEQESFIDSRSGITVCLGGNGSGKTYCGAMRCVQFLCEQQPPPKRNTPFWVIGDTYEEACGSCWDQKLCDLLPPSWVDHDKIDWFKPNRNWPFAVPLKPWKDHDPNKNWVLEFKSYEQGRAKMQARAIGGAWFTEQFPWDVFSEVLRGCREWMYPGSVWCEFTPVDPEKSLDMQAIYEKWLSGDEEYKNWSFHRLNTAAAMEAGHANEEWFDTFFGTISEEMKETRMTGAFASYEGAIYQSFNPALHLADRLSFAMGA